MKINKAKFDRWNNELESIMKGGVILVAAVEIVVQNAGLTFVADDEDEAGVVTCCIYQRPNGELVNCWLEGAEVGFDDQVAWYKNIVTCESCGKRFDWTADSDYLETETGDVCGECIREVEASTQPECPDDCPTQALHVISGTVKGNAFIGEDSDLLWIGNPAETPQSVVAKSIDGLEDGYAEVQPIAEIMRFLRAGEDVVVASDEISRDDAYIVELQWRDA